MVCPRCQRPRHPHVSATLLTGETALRRQYNWHRLACELLWAQLEDVSPPGSVLIEVPRKRTHKSWHLEPPCEPELPRHQSVSGHDYACYSRWRYFDHPAYFDSDDFKPNPRSYPKAYRFNPYYRRCYYNPYSPSPSPSVPRQCFED